MVLIVPIVIFAIVATRLPRVDRGHSDDPEAAVIAPNPSIALVMLSGAYFVGGIFTPAFLSVQALVSPARVRSLSFAFGSLFLVVGLDLFFVFLGNVGNDNVRNGMIALAVSWV